MQEFISKKGSEHQVSDYSFYQDDIFTEFSNKLNWERKIAEGLIGNIRATYAEKPGGFSPYTTDPSQISFSEEETLSYEIGPSPLCKPDQLMKGCASYKRSAKPLIKTLCVDMSKIANFIEELPQLRTRILALLMGGLM